ncbi:MAG: deoxyguanosinetriphosphate triphosphohydrolase [Bifidobacteriaceae bacterium]|jgi:dGTPase|nr:deoxyguanosinetriphosphate triphosphohydrolase [Bifidobacteriaceae bacterium]
MSPYGPDASARQIDESDKTSGRTEFERDRARLLHSAALRRLGAKTQVRTPWRRADHPTGDDFIRTRLTHSLEVAQVGRELGKALGCDPEVVDTACLAHDLGHPPFGHNGERALAEVAQPAGGFEGNAQTLRLLTRLEAKVYARGRSWGLNLTRACLDASIKYPWRRGEGPAGSDPAKFGVYEPEAEAFEWVRQGAAPLAKCVEAQVMDLADDVAYSVHDVEDGIVGGSILPEALSSPPELRAVAGLALGRYWSGEAGELEAAAWRLTALGFWPRGWDGSRQALAGLKNMTSGLIGRFVLAARNATRQVYGPGRLARYAAEVVVPRETAAEIAVLKALAALFVMQPRREDPVYLRQRAILKELFGYLMDAAPGSLQPEFRADFLEAGDEAARVRVVVDQLASLTDSSAQIEHSRFAAGGERPGPPGAGAGGVS